MARRLWFFVLRAGLFASLPACTMPMKNGAATNGEALVSFPELPAKDQPADSSPYGIIPYIQKLTKSAPPAKSKEEQVAKSPYASQPEQPEPISSRQPPAKENPIDQSSPYAVIPRQEEQVTKSSSASESKQPEPPPPEPPPPLPEPPVEPIPVANLKQGPVLPSQPLPAPSADIFESSEEKESDPGDRSGSFSPYAEILGQPPRVRSNPRPDSSVLSPASPYAALRQVSIAGAAKTSGHNGNSLISMLKQPGFPLASPASPWSPYAVISSQPLVTSAAKVSPKKLDADSPYAPTATRTPMRMSSGSFDPALSRADQSETDAAVLQARFPEQPEMHPINDQPPPSGPKIDLDLASDFSSAPDSPIARKNGEPPWLTALRCFASKRPSEAVSWLKRYDEPNQELLLRLSPLIVRIAAAELTRTDAEKGTELIDGLSNLLAIPIEGDLVIGKLCLCKHIKTFGNYDPFPEDHAFQTRDLVWIYVEVRNFSSVRRDVGNGETVYETRLKTTARITNDAGTKEWPLQFDRRCETDQSRSLRRDYWDNLSFNVPDNLPPGGYTLWLKVVDEPTGRFKERSVDFQVVPAKGGL